MPANSEFFAKFPNRTFIETGSCAGEGIKAALDAGFQSVLSVELGEKLYHRTCERFRGDDRVQLVHGYSRDFLAMVLPIIDHPCTFWLDAHDSGGDTVKGDDDPPIWNELKKIAEHSIKSHTILIDDIAGWPMDQLYAALREINPDYRFSICDGVLFDGQNYKVDPKAILVAQP